MYSTDPACIAGTDCWLKAAHDHVLYSDDGVNWLSGAHAGDIKGCGTNAQCGDEYQVAELHEGGGGTVVGVSRHPAEAAMTLSTDSGSSFGPMRTLPGVPTADCQISLVNADSGSAVDRLLIGAPSNPATRQNMTLSAGSATGIWSGVLQLSPTAESYAGYSAMAQLSSGAVLVMWEGPCFVGAPPGLTRFCLTTINMSKPQA
eukprot:COSAG05_NODE_6839_length_893_cov_2.607053_1_plen_203_part_00